MNIEFWLNFHGVTKKDSSRKRFIESGLTKDEFLACLSLNTELESSWTNKLDGFLQGIDDGLPAHPVPYSYQSSLTDFITRLTASESKRRSLTDLGLAMLQRGKPVQPVLVALEKFYLTFGLTKNWNCPD